MLVIAVVAGSPKASAKNGLAGRADRRAEDAEGNVRFRTARGSAFVKMAFFVIASLWESCHYAKAPEGERLFLFFASKMLPRRRRDIRSPFFQN